MRMCVPSLLAGVASLALAATAASAADLPARAAPPAPIIAAAPIFTWTGFYAGLNAGWGWRNSDQQSVFLTPGAATPGLAGTLIFNNNDDGGFTGGGQVGYNYQIGAFVIGAEADIQWADTNKNVNVAFIPAAGSTGTFVPGTFKSNLEDWWGSVRARVGVAFDRVLIYGTGGFAYTDNDTGWIAGGGVEWALPTNWNLFGSSAVTFGVEALYINIDRGNDNNAVGTFTPAGGTPVSVITPVSNNGDDEFWVARAKLNFKFGTY